MSRIILASQSPRRKQLLEWAEIDFEVIVKETDEYYPSNLAVEEVPVYIARNKALAVKGSLTDGSIIIAADTIVVLGDRIIGKPKHADEALQILSALSGRKHLVITGVIILKDHKEMAFADITEVYFHELSQEQIIYYINNYRPYDKAGAYAIQEWIGVTGIKFIRGDFYNVMGLPVSRVVQALNVINKT